MANGMTNGADGFRIEKDSMGEVRVPVDALYGAQTQRAVDNFPISGQPLPRPFLRALGLVKRVAADDKTKGGIILPDTAKEKPREGIVVAVGNGKLLDTGSRQAMSVKKNDRVLFSSYAGSEIKMDGDELLILGEDEILAIIEN